MNSNKKPSFLAIFAAILLGVMLVATAIPAVFYFPAQRFLLRPDSMTEAILASDLPERMPDLMAGWILDGTFELENGDSDFLRALDREDYRAILEILAPRDWIAVQSAIMARQVQDYLLGKSDTLNITLDLSEIGERMKGDALTQTADQIVASQENCSALDLANLTLAVTGNPSGALPFCQPPDIFRPLVVQTVKIGLQQIAAQLPPIITFEVLQMNLAARVAQVFRFITRFWPWMPWLTLALALAILVVLGGSLRHGLLGVGIPLSLAGVVSGGVTLVLTLVHDSTLTPWIANQLTLHLPASLAAILTPVLTGVLGRFCLSGLIWGGAAFVLGIVLVIVSRIVKR